MRLHIESLTSKCLTLFISAVVLGGCATNPTHKFVVGTWNVQFVAFDDSDCCNVDDREDLVADAIRRSGADVFLVNEAFLHGIQTTARDDLIDVYPHQVNKIDGRNSDTLHISTASELVPFLRGTPIGEIFDFTVQDSGLMLLSRHPFTALPGLKPTIADDADAVSAGAEWSDVGYAQFRVCEDNILGAGEGTDCSAHKGVGFVRVLHPNGITYNIATTHLESSAEEPGLAALIRSDQLETTAARFFDSTFGGSLTDTEPVIFTGDFNVTGTARSPPSTPGTVPGAAVRPEWDARFSTAGQYFTDNFVDTWENMINHPQMRGSMLKDPGQTSSLGRGRRIDYIFHNDATIPAINGKLCVQHVRVGTDFMRNPNTGRELSDHRPLIAEFNAMAPFCSPDRAREVTASDFANADSSVTFDDAQTRVFHQGGAQWYLLMDPGTYTFSAPSSSADQLAIEVYSSTNMSNTLVPYREVGGPFGDGRGGQVTGVTYVADNAPLFVKVKAEDENNTGQYSFVIHKHAGTSQLDAITLYPNKPKSIDWPTGFGRAVDSLWFSIDTDGPFSGAAQMLRFSAAATTGTAPMSITLQDSSGAIVETRDSPLLRNDTMDNNREYYMSVSLIAGGRPSSVITSWETNLSVLTIRDSDIALQMSRFVATDVAGIGDDDAVRLNFFSDGIQVYPVSRPSSDGIGVGTIILDRRPNFGDVEESETHAIDQKVACSIGFLGSLGVTLTESDTGDLFAGDDDSVGGVILGLPPSASEQTAGTVQLTGTGEYGLLFNLARGTHGSNKPTIITNSLDTAFPPISCATRS